MCELFIYNNLSKIDKVINVEIQHQENNVVVGSFRFNKVKVGFIEQNDSKNGINIFANILKTSFNIPSNKKKAFKQKFIELYNEVKDTIGVHIKYDFDKNEDKLKLTILNSIPYKKIVADIKYILEPLLEVIYVVYLRFLSFFLEYKAEEE